MKRGSGLPQTKSDGAFGAPSPFFFAHFRVALWREARLMYRRKKAQLSLGFLPV
jgi:hypothetical protein